ncbi:FAD-dependent oxidoreductase [Pseudonocardia alni]|jgi:2-polyprenyl-6-methoxyphenol hydroxylase-like FAD-dependent oxidoreductase|uniref:FAD-dependent oxidoreductase n=1 Tax=Pseudonocardia TaxID=1847 RepID=UPI002096BEC0|nr:MULTISPECIES: NAD(P)/FAD-dependent oxidoreductase [Pseudonocardia]MCO7192058.1 FAD-dependent monooxygenase [Pseudonocardia sp. McavD-2-B]WFG47247.1 FAD-dependent monooxygenase [Pseudonocardia alni]
MTTDPDVIVVGASIAGNTAATLLARGGARVLLLEKHTREDAYKVFCTHTLQPSAMPVLDRLGVRPAMEAAGAVHHRSNYWTRWGWVRPRAEEGSEDLPHGLNLRRQALDPIFRRMAAETPGVELRLGQTVTDLVREGDRVTGVRVKTRDGAEETIHARLVVGADGRFSKLAQLSGADMKVTPNNRFAYFAYFQDLQPREDPPTNIWFLDPDGAYVMPNEDGVSVVIVAPKKTEEHLAAFREDTEGAFHRFVRALPDAPPIDDAERVSKFNGMMDFSLRERHPHAAPGLALVGDAALSTDPMWGIGCAWGMQSASWLADSVADTLDVDDEVDAALATYAGRHKAEVGGYQRLFENFASARPLNAMERLMYSASIHDPQTARHLYSFGSRLIKIPEFGASPAVARAVLAQQAVSVEESLASLREVPFLNVDEIEALVRAESEPALAVAGS